MDEKLLEEYQKISGPLSLGYKEDKKDIVGCEIQLTSKGCFVCRKEVDKTGAVKLCLKHFLELHKRVDNEMRKWAKEKGIYMSQLM